MSTFLLPVQPLSFGTAETESLWSFYSRVAILHGYGSSQLLRALRGAFEPDAAADGESRLYTGNGLNGSGLWVRAVADLLQKGLGRGDLNRLTLFPFPAYVPRTSKTVRAGTKNISRLRNWCEMCLLEDNNRQVDAHDRLIWSISYIERCPFHRVRLRSSCPSCCQPQKHHNMSLGLSHCYSCGSSLVGSADLIQPDLLPHYGERECVELVTAIASGEISSIAPDVVPRFYRTLDEMCAPLHRIDRRKIKEKNLSRGARSSSTLSNLIEISIRHQVSITQLSAEPELAAKASFGQILASPRSGDPLVGRSYNEVIDDVRSLMERGLAAPDGIRIPTLAEISTLFRLRSFSFRLEFPDLAQRYVCKVLRQGHLLLRRETGNALIDRLDVEGKLPYLTDGEVQSMLEDELDLSQGSVSTLLRRSRRRRAARNS
ncbi:TniQ family protein [Stenotrophomonas maltophilia]|uniref:TniQ family protein n=1 Tax=Stenotrophomonas maltophilia TaxID=40324 RepID=UPI0032010FC6|nr:TniQ family protein [Stenotrophomonas maltophilia]